MRIWRCLAYRMAAIVGKGYHRLIVWRSERISTFHDEENKWEMKRSQQWKPENIVRRAGFDWCISRHVIIQLLQWNRSHGYVTEQ